MPCSPNKPEAGRPLRNANALSRSVTVAIWWTLTWGAATCAGADSGMNAPGTRTCDSACNSQGANLAPPVTGFWGDRVVYTLNTTVYTRHFYDNAHHNNYQHTIDLERWQANGWLQGGAILRNSFDQPIQYVYLGRAWRPLDSFPAAYIKLTGGLVHGYKGEYRDKIPLNHYGVAPALLPSIGLSNKYFIGEVLLFGTAGFLVNVGVVFK